MRETPKEPHLPATSTHGGHMEVAAPIVPTMLDEQSAGELVDIALDNASPAPFWAPWGAYAVVVLGAQLTRGEVPAWILSVFFAAVLFGSIGLAWFRSIRAGMRLADVHLEPGVKRKAYRLAVRRRRHSRALFMKRADARARILAELCPREPR